MIPAAVAAFQGLKIGTRVAIIAGIFSIIVGSYAATYLKGKHDGKAIVRAEWDQSIAEQSQKIAQEAVKVDAMESKVVLHVDAQERAIEEQSKEIRKKVIRHATPKTITISPATVQLHDELRELSNEAGRSVPTADSGSGTSQVPPGGMGPPAPPLVPIEIDGAPVILTYEELTQAMTDYFEKYAKLRNKYQGFSAWNDGREAIEKARIPNE
jgi:hypothetical protein